MNVNHAAWRAHFEGSLVVFLAALGVAAGCVPAPPPAEMVRPAAASGPRIMFVSGELASINVGHGGGVDMGMVLQVRREGVAVAKLRIAEVSEHAAAGIVFDGEGRCDDAVVIPAPASRPATRPAAAPASRTDSVLSARITAVAEAVASVDVGSRDGVRVGMVFAVFRGGEFVAHLRILDVDGTSSAAAVYDKVHEPAPGDRAICLDR